jgi:hypothetical protein
MEEEKWGRGSRGGGKVRRLHSFIHDCSSSYSCGFTKAERYSFESKRIGMDG